MKITTKTQANTQRPVYSKKNPDSFIPKNYYCLQYAIVNNSDQTKYTIEDMVKKITAQSHKELLDKNLNYICEEDVITQESGYILMWNKNRTFEILINKNLKDT